MKKLRVIWGAPCSGKTTYCKNNLQGNDVVWDYDQIKRALTYGEDHELIDWIQNLIIKMRGTFLRTVKDDPDIDDAFMIVSYVSDELKKFIEEDIGIKDVEYHLVESTLAECLSRLEKDDSRPDKERETELIKKWFKDHGSKEEKALTKKLEDRQLRSADLFRAAEQESKDQFDYIVEGYATNWEPYELYQDDDGPVYERFEKTAFDDADMSDIIMLYDHQGKVLARQSNQTLEVSIDDKGLFVRADLSKSEAAKALYTEIKEGLITRMSWAFRLGDYEYDKKTRTIIHRSVKKIYDVSAVGRPANDMTSINARSFADGVIMQEQTERSERDQLALLIDLELIMNEENYE